MNKLNKRKCNNCGKEFQKRYSLQYLCSPKCEREYKRKKEDAKQGSKKHGAKRKSGIAPVSEKRLEELAEYRKLRKEFLAKPENHYCPVMKHLLGVHVRVTEIHHTNSRNGKRLNKTEDWLAVSRQGHRWIHDNPKEARELGFLI